MKGNKNSRMNVIATDPAKNQSDSNILLKELTIGMKWSLRGKCSLTCKENVAQCSNKHFSFPGDGGRKILKKIKMC